MPLVRIDAAELAKLKQYAQLTQTIRTAQERPGSTVTAALGQPGQSIVIRIDNLPLGDTTDRDAIKSAFQYAIVSRTVAEPTR
jgi:hypothetical protein